jgi:hypothetical protein
MDPELEPLFERKSPPPGGLGRLRSRLAADEARARRTAPRWTWALPGLAAAAAAVFVFARAPTPSAPPSLAPPAMVQLHLAAPPTTPVSVLPAHQHRVAVQAVPTADERVIYYRVQVLTPDA